MLKLKKQSNGDYNITLQKPIEILDKEVAQKMKKEVKRLINKNRVLNVNLDCVDEFAEGAYKVLGDIIGMAKRKGCIVNIKVDGINIASQLM